MEEPTNHLLVNAPTNSGEPNEVLPSTAEGSNASSANASTVPTVDVSSASSSSARDDAPSPVPRSFSSASPRNIPRNLGRRGKNFLQDELINFFSIMEVILPIGPEEWLKVLTEHSVLFPGRDVDGLRRKYTSVYRKKVPTGDPNIPLEVEMAKKVKYLIGDKAMVGGGSEEYDMANNTFVDPSDTNVITANPTPPGIVRDSGNVSVATINSAESNSGSSDPSLSTNTTSTSAAQRSNVTQQNMTSPAFLNGLVPRTSTSNKGKSDIMDIMLLQMQTEAAERAHERRERAEDRKEFSKLIASIACGFMQSTSSHKKKKKKKRSRKRKHNILEISSSSSSSSSSNSSSDEEENNN